MGVIIREKTDNEDMKFFLRLGFWALKTLRKEMYDEIMRDQPNASEDEAFEIHKKETTDYMDFNSPDVKVFIAFLDDERCGYVWMAPRNSKDGWDLERPQWIYDIVVDPKFQGKGIGRQLMKRAEEYAQTLRQNIGLFVHADNESAIALYNKTGYRMKVVPLSKKMSDSRDAKPSDNLTMKQIDALDEALRRMELEKFAEKVHFSVDADDEVISEQYEKFIQSSVKPDGKQTRFVASSIAGEHVGCAWIGTSGFNDKVAMLYSIVISDSEKRQEIGTFLMESVEAWAQSVGFATVYVLLHAEDDLDLEFFKKIGYKIPGYFMELRLNK
jgi:ribosomal-protein-alanine N-acetyltransferase